ncbi:hypothetical protein O181_069841 [Austropuccinia psidii MF-1]|uniref:Secreted protein n=1 Tax=Austropuccinia psidii MF-1 TaxID=1389203 RepID=A0A9Q3I554_9BASI|nr:hypothetical protein [Austropuccinia psidii MF-1]
MGSGFVLQLVRLSGALFLSRSSGHSLNASPVASAAAAWCGIGSPRHPRCPSQTLLLARRLGLTWKAARTLVWLRLSP